MGQSSEFLSSEVNWLLKVIWSSIFL